LGVLRDLHKKLTKREPSSRKDPPPYHSDSKSVI